MSRTKPIGGYAEVRVNGEVLEFRGDMTFNFQALIKEGVVGRDGKHHGFTVKNPTFPTSRAITPSAASTRPRSSRRSSMRPSPPGWPTAASSCCAARTWPARCRSMSTRRRARSAGKARPAKSWLPRAKGGCDGRSYDPAERRRCLAQGPAAGGAMPHPATTRSRLGGLAPELNIVVDAQRDEEAPAIRQRRRHPQRIRTPCSPAARSRS